ncbi:hypothetical protein HZA33_04670 [Candidatus Pacearchaeota archaeon]|nr:hypothetical protein [Candidatus Pacearchaeota archaeon]
MLFKKKPKEDLKLTMPTLPSAPSSPSSTTKDIAEIKSTLEKKDYSTLPELPSLPELSPTYTPDLELERPEIKEIRAAEFKFPEAEEGEKKKMTMEIGESTFAKPMMRSSFQPSQFTPTGFQFKEFKAEESRIIEQGAKISGLDRPIYVKIDKFKDALNSFELVKKKIREIDVLLKKIKETREKENEELLAWEQEISEIKEKMNSVDAKLFSKLD